MTPGVIKDHTYVNRELFDKNQIISVGSHLFRLSAILMRCSAPGESTFWQTPYRILPRIDSTCGSNLKPLVKKPYSRHSFSLPGREELEAQVVAFAA